VILPLLLTSAWVEAAELGTVVGLVFDASGAPVAGLSVRVGGASTVTDAEGGFAIEVQPGEFEAELGVDVRLPGVVVRSGATTELLVTLSDPPVVGLELPSGSQAKVEERTGPPGVLAGQVIDPARKAPLAGARIFVRGATATAVSDEDGRFTLTLPEGPWDLSILRPGYGTRGLSATVVANETSPLQVELEKTGMELPELTVSAPRIVGGTSSALDERREASTVSDVLGAEQMSKAGDSDAGSALKRVTGLTVVGGKYVYVRGLGDRYSSTLLNGSSLPSPEPEKRVVPLDLFPTSLIESVVIQKTPSPDRPGEWGGGIVEVKTRTVPEKPVFNIGLSGTWVAGTTLGTAELAPAGPTDWLGFGQEFRALPASVAAASAEAPIKPGGIFSEGGYSAEELEALGEAMPNRWGLSAREVPPDYGATLNAGGRLRFGKLSLGGLVGMVYGNGWDIEEGTRSNYANAGGGELVLSRKTAFVESQNKVRLGGALALGVDWDEDYSLTSTTLLNRGSTASGITYAADDPTGTGDTRSQRSAWVEQQLLFEQLAARADFGAVLVEGRYSIAFATRDEPDRREWTYNETEDGGYVLSQRGGWSDIQFLSLDDQTQDGALDVTIPIPKLGTDTRLKVGGQRASRTRSAGTRRFGYSFKGTDGLDLSQPIESLMVPENIGEENEDDAGYLQFEENTINSDDYSAGQEIYAAYAMADAGLLPRLRALGGVRLERSEQTVSTFQQFDTEKEPVLADLGSTDWLPAATLTFAVGPAKNPDIMLVRAAYGRTLSRPEFRELTEVQYYDYRSGRTLYGNPELRRATIDHADVRWEWYPRDGESVSAGVFFKYFDHPIESVVAVSAVSGSVGTFANATSATNYGLEVDARQRLDIVHEALSDVYLSGNVAAIVSEVDLSDTEGNQTSTERPLQGQSPWVVNLTASYENPDLRTNVSLLYNVFGPRIVDVGTSGIPDTYEMPVHQLDLVYTQGIGKHFSTRLKATNLLDWPVTQMVGDKVSEETHNGWSVGLGLTWTP
jgi:outer membrane receptor protein involved in Fe transport